MVTIVSALIVILPPASVSAGRFTIEVKLFACEPYNLKSKVPYSEESS